MTLLQIRYFIEAAKRGSITEAAKAMFVVQPAVTKQLNELEKELGFRLFTRHPRGVELTAAGEIMLRAFESCQAEYRAALARAREISSMVDRVSVGLLSSIDLYNVSNVINAFIGEHFDVSVNILRLPMEEIFTALETEKIDVAVVIDTSIPPNRGIRHENLFPSRDYILTAKDSPLAAKETVTPEELVGAAVRMKSRGNIGLAFTYNEPLIGWEFVRDAAALAHEAGLLNVMVTNGTAEAPVLEALLPYVDAMNVDLKGFTEAYYSEVLGGDLKTVKAFIARAVKSCHVELTTLIVPGLNDSEAEMRALTEWVADLKDADGNTAGGGVPLHISRFFPRFHMTDRPATEKNTVYRLADTARERLSYVYTGNC